MRFFIFNTFLFLLCFNISAQVTIGSAHQANIGTLLDLKQENKEDGTANSKLGLMLPRVMLQDAFNLFPMFEDDGANGYEKNNIPYDKGDEDEKHTGLVVYNALGKPEAGLCEGLYVWDSVRWLYLGNGDCSFFRITSPANKILDFGIGETPYTVKLVTSHPKWQIAWQEKSTSGVFKLMNPNIAIGSEQLGSNDPTIAVVKEIALSPYAGTEAYVGFGPGGTVETDKLRFETIDSEPQTQELILKRTIPEIFRFARIEKGSATGVIKHEGETVNIYANTNVAWQMKTSLTVAQTQEAEYNNASPNYGYGEKMQSITIPVITSWNAKTFDFYVKEKSKSDWGDTKETAVQKGYTLKCTAPISDVSILPHHDSYNFTMTTETSIPSTPYVIGAWDYTSGSRGQRLDTGFENTGVGAKRSMFQTNLTWENKVLKFFYQRPGWDGSGDSWVEINPTKTFTHAGYEMHTNGNNKIGGWSGGYLFRWKLSSGYMQSNSVLPAFQVGIWVNSQTPFSHPTGAIAIKDFTGGSRTESISFDIPDNFTTADRSLSTWYSQPGHHDPNKRWIKMTDTNSEKPQYMSAITRNGITIAGASLNQVTSNPVDHLISTPAQEICQQDGFRMPTKAEITQWMGGVGAVNSILSPTWAAANNFNTIGFWVADHGTPGFCDYALFTRVTSTTHKFEGFRSQLSTSSSKQYIKCLKP